MSKKHELKEGLVYAAPLTNGFFTVAQLYNHHKISSRSSEDTFGFFNKKLSFEELEGLKTNIDNLDLSEPFSILTLNSSPWDYDWILLGHKNLTINESYKKNIGSLGLFNNYSVDPSIILEPYFGLFPWDGYYKDDYLDKHILDVNDLPKNIKYLRDYSTKELKKILPSNNIKLKKRIENEKS